MANTTPYSAPDIKCISITPQHVVAMSYSEHPGTWDSCLDVKHKSIEL